eukprot:COSAG02_NODE_16955_length_1040_cov_1.880978_1_plen_67_part_00
MGKWLSFLMGWSRNHFFVSAVGTKSWVGVVLQAPVFTRVVRLEADIFYVVGCIPPRHETLQNGDVF